MTSIQSICGTPILYLNWIWLDNDSYTLRTKHDPIQRDASYDKLGVQSKIAFGLNVRRSVMWYQCWCVGRARRRPYQDILSALPLLLHTLIDCLDTPGQPVPSLIALIHYTQGKLVAANLRGALWWTRYQCQLKWTVCMRYWAAHPFKLVGSSTLIF